MRPKILVIVYCYHKKFLLGNIFNCSVVERKIWKKLTKTKSSKMILTWVKNHVVFITPFLYLKIISMSVDHSNSTFI